MATDNLLLDLQAKTLPPVLYGTMSITALGALGPGVFAVSRGETPSPLAFGYFAGTGLLLVAAFWMRQGRILAAARLGGASWLLMSIFAGLFGTGASMATIVPTTLALTLAIAAVFDEDGVLGWTTAVAACWIGIVAGRSALGVPIDPDPSVVPVVALVPAACLFMAGLGIRASVLHRRAASDRADRVRAQLTSTVANLQQANRDIEQARDEVIEANRAKSAFLANMSHELRTPLNAIIGYSEMVREELEDQEEPDLVADIQRVESSGKHLLSLINDILDLSRIEAGQLVLNVAEFDSAKLIVETATLIRPLAEKKGLRLVVELEDDLPFMQNDRMRLRQVLLNLLSNAVKFTGEGRIDLVAAVSADGNSLVLSVSDTGIGMSPDQLGRVFNPFVQAEDTTTRRFGGTGLGLSISQTLAGAMGGEITARSRLGEGSTFQVSVPLWAGETTSPKTDPTMRITPGEGPLVLLVDDDEDARELYRRTLTGAGYSIAEAASGETGLAVARSQRPAAIVLDVRMPGMDGWQVLQAIKDDTTLQDTPVVLVTFLNDPQRGFSLGAAEYLNKPIDRRRLRQVIRKMCTDPTRPVLIVDDDEDVRDLLSRTLGDDGWTTVVATNGREGLEVLDRTNPAAVLLDLMMPEVDGFGFLKGLRERGSTVPVIVVTAKELTLDDQERLDAQTSRVLRKGELSHEQLLADLGRLVEA